MTVDGTGGCRGWIGVDLDGTLSRWEPDQGWKPGLIGDPVPAMVERVQAWVAEGWEVKVFTARLSAGGPVASRETAAIQAWTLEHVGREPEATCVKDYRMVELWDDRAVGVEFNTGAVRGGERPLRI